MKAILAITAICICITSGLVFYINGGPVKLNNLTLKQDRGSLTVRPAVVVIKPAQ